MKKTRTIPKVQDGGKKKGGSWGVLARILHPGSNEGQRKTVQADRTGEPGARPWSWFREVFSSFRLPPACYHKANWIRAGLTLFMAALVVGGPIFLFRSRYTTGKRLREVEPGRFYRSGQMTAEGFAEAVARLRIRTILNVQDDFPDPDLRKSFWYPGTIKESELCRQLGVRFIQISPDLISRRRIPKERPAAIEKFLQVMDNEANYPVLIHCKAGLHRTGVLSAVYRMEYQGWSRGAAWRELRAHGFGIWKCTSANDYVKQYVLTYRPGLRFPVRNTSNAE